MVSRHRYIHPAVFGSGLICRNVFLPDSSFSRELSYSNIGPFHREWAHALSNIPYSLDIEGLSIFSTNSATSLFLPSRKLQHSPSHSILCSRPTRSIAFLDPAGLCKIHNIDRSERILKFVGQKWQLDDIKILLHQCMRYNSVIRQ